MIMKILILRFSSIGDIVLTTPVVRCLKQQAGAEIHFLTKKNFESILTSNPYLDRVFSFQQDVAEVLPALKKERYDLVVDLHRNLRSLRVKLALRRPFRSFDKLNLKKWWLVNTGFDCLPDIHIVERYMNTVCHLPVAYDGKGLDYFIPAGEEADLKTISQQLTTGNYIAFVIGATHATKQLPEKKITAICRHLHHPVVLLGGPAEAASGARIAADAGTHVVNACGTLSLHQSASVVRQAGKVATHDTGLMHIAAAFHKEIVSIWGNTVPKFGMYPFYPAEMNLNTIIEAPDLRCRPCSKIGYSQCPKQHFNCMNTLDIMHICSVLTLDQTDSKVT